MCAIWLRLNWSFESVNGGNYWRYVRDRVSFYKWIPAEMHPQKLALAWPRLCICSDKPITPDKRSDVWKTWSNAYTIGLTVTLFHSLLSSEWFFLALSRCASGWKQAWWKSECFWAPWPWNDVPTVSISPCMDLELQHHRVSQDTTNEATRETAKKKEKSLTQTY